MLVSKKIKIEVSSADVATLEFMQGKCRGLYNWLVMRLRNRERWNFKEMKRSLQESKQHDPELNQVYGKLLAEVYYRLDGAMKAFYRRLKAGETPGFPRVRPRHCFFTLCYPAMYIKIENDVLTLPTGGGGKHGPKVYPNIKAKLTEPAPEGFREVAISRDARGDYYASFSHRRQEEDQQQGEVVAFDLGVKTLAVRMEQHDCSGRKVAGYLSKHKKVQKVFYPGLADHPQHELAKRQMSGFGALIAFETGSLANANQMLRKVRVCSLAESLGGVETLISHPATMTHAAVGEEGRRKIGITDGMVRISVGIEDVDDILADLEQALAAI